MQQPIWLALAWAELGEAERVGGADNPRILAYYRDAGHPEIVHDEIAWCAAFAGAIIERSGIVSTRSLLARSYAGFGEALADFRLGAIAVLSRGSDPGAGHVGFLVGESGDTIHLLGGNQSDKVSVEAFKRSRLLALRWPTGVETAGGPAAQDTHPVAAAQETEFETALAHVLEMEGGWTDDPYDPGGPTNRGVTLAVYARHRGVTLDEASTARLTAELKVIPEPVVRDIYHARYWLPSRAPHLPAGLALMHFDASVNHGVGGAARLLQQAVEADIDGEIGPLTLAAARRGDTLGFLEAYADLRRARYRALPHFWRFGRGWLQRVDTTLISAKQSLAARTSGTHPTTSSPSQTSSTSSQKGPTTMTELDDASNSVQPKWWGESLTIWGVVVTTLATVLPVIGPLFGLDVTAELVHQIGAQATQVMQAIGGLAGTLMTIAGRARATSGLMRRDVVMKV